MSAIDRFLRGLAFIAYMCTFMGILTLETFLRPLYYPIFGEKIKKKKGFEPYQILTRWFAKTFNSIFAIRVEGFGLNNAKGIEPCIVMFTHGSNYDSVAINTVHLI